MTPPTENLAHNRLRVAPHFSSGIVEQAKRDIADKKTVFSRLLGATMREVQG